MLTLTYEFKLKPNQEQIVQFESWLEVCRKVYNFALAQRKHWYNSRSCKVNACQLHSEYIIPADIPRPNYFTQAKALTEARKINLNLKAVHSQVLQQTLRRLETAFVSMWEQNFGFPRFKKVGCMRSFVFPQLGKDPLKKGVIKLPSFGWVKFRQSREIPDGSSLKQARIVRRSSGWYIMLTLQWDVEVPKATPSGEAVGVDVGLLSFLATSNGLTLPRPKFFGDLERKLKLLQQSVSRKKLGSNNSKKAHHKVAKLHEHISNTRKDFHWKTAHRLCDEVGMVFVEDLNLKGLCRGMLGKHCLDASWGQFFTILEQCCFKRDVYFQKVDAKKTSQICPNCGTETGKKELSQRTHSCGSCRYTTDRDVAAAQVVMQRGLSAVGHTVKMLNEGKVVGLPVN